MTAKVAPGENASGSTTSKVQVRVSITELSVKAVSIQQALKFNFKLVVYSCASFIPVALFHCLSYASVSFGLEDDAGLYAFNFDYRGVYVPPSSAQKSRGQGALKFLGVMIFAAFWCITFFPFVFFVYLGAKNYPWRAFVPQFLITTLFFGVTSVDKNPRVGHIGTAFYPIVAIMGCMISLKYGLHKTSKAHHCLYYILGIWFVIYMFGSFSLVFDTLRDPGYLWVKFVFALPLFKEVVRYLGVRCGWYFCSQADVAGPGVVTHRANAWAFFCWVQVMMAIYVRFEITNIGDPNLELAMVIFSGVLEVVMRTTMQKRDRLIRKVNPFNGSRTLEKQQTVLIDIHSGNSSKAISRKVAEANFYSITVLSEMIAEYVGIMSATFSLWFWAAKPLYRTFPAYDVDGLYEGTLDISRFITSMLVQLFIEMVVDSICVVYETRYRGLNFHRAWKTQSPKAVFAILLYSVWYAVLITVGAVLQDTYNCVGHPDLCLCYDDLPSLHQRYCRTLYPLDGGMAPNATRP